MIIHKEAAVFMVWKYLDSLWDKDTNPNPKICLSCGMQGWKESEECPDCKVQWTITEDVIEAMRDGTLILVDK